KPIPGQPAQMEEELDRIDPIQRLRPHQRVHLAARCQPPHDREMVPRLPLIDDRSSSPRGVGLDHTREQIEPRFVYENKLAALAPGRSLQPRPRLGSPTGDGFLVPLDGAGDRDLRGPSQSLEQPRYLALAVRDVEFLPEHTGDPATGPDVPPEAIGLG